MKRENFENLSISRTEKKQVAYVDEFRELIRSHPKIFSIFNNLEHKLSSENPEKSWRINKSASLDGVSVTLILSIQTVSIFKVEVNGESFCVKKDFEPGPEPIKPDYPPIGHDAFNEINALTEAKKLLSKVKGVDVVEFHFAFRDSGSNNYLVSKYYDLPKVEEFLYEISQSFSKKDTELESSIKKRVREIKNRLVGFYDVTMHNMFYDKSSDKIIIFDLHKIKKQTEK